MTEVLIIILVNFILYYKSLKMGYISDDKAELKDKVWDKTPYKFILGITKNKQVDHFKSIIIHTLACISIYFALGANQVSFLTALLFSVNPVNNQGAIWISGRHYALCALCLMASLALPLLSPLFILIGSVSPLAFFAPVGFLGKNNYLILLIPFIWLLRRKRLFTEFKSRRSGEILSFDTRVGIHKIIVSIKIYSFYFLLSLIPSKISWYHSFMHSGSGGGNKVMSDRAVAKDHYFWLGIGLGLFTILSIVKGYPWAWGLFWYTVCIAPYLNLYRMNQEIGERYAYIPNIGIMYALCTIIPLPLFFFLLGAYSFRMFFYYTKAYIDDYWLLETNVAENPASWYAWLIRARIRIKQKSYREALNMLTFARMLDPLEFKILFNLGVMMRIYKRPKESEAWFNEAEKNIIKGQEESSKEYLRLGRAGKIGFIY